MTHSALGALAVYTGSDSPGPFSLVDLDANPILFEDDADLTVQMAAMPTLALAAQVTPPTQPSTALVSTERIMAAAVAAQQTTIILAAQAESAAHQLL